MRPSDLLVRVEGAFDSLRGRGSRFDIARTRQMEMRAAYTGALFNRLNSDWIVMPLQSDQELITDLKLLRTRTRDLGRNNPFAVKFMQMLEDNVIGPTGIGMRAQLPDGQGGLATTQNRKLMDAWAFFSDSVTTDGRSSLVDYCQMAVQSLAQDGEIFAEKRIGRQYEYGLAINTVDPDLVDELYNVARNEWNSSNEVRLSIEVDNEMRRVAYHCYREPSVYGQLSRQRYAIPADAMIHLGRARRINQTRYVPWFHPVMGAMKELDGLGEAELVASRLAASKMGWIQMDESAGPMPGEINSTGSRTPIPMEATPGSISIMPKGYSFQGWDPQHPTTAFASFHAAIIRKIAAGLGVSYTSLANDPGDANYSSSRTALQMEQRFWRKLQQFFVRKFMVDLFREFLRTAPLTGNLDLGFGMSDPKKVLPFIAWETPGWEWIDPKNDVEAAVLAIQNNLDSPQRVVGARGLDFERDIINPKKEAQRLISEAGLDPAPTAAPGVGSPANGDTQTDPKGAVSADSAKDAPPVAPSRNGTAKPKSRIPA